MAKKPSPIVFEDLDGDDPEFDRDDDMVDPLDLEDPAAERAAPDDDPRAGDPFAVADDDDEPGPLVEDDGKESDEDPEQEEPGQPDDLKAENERLRARLAALERDASLSRKELAEAQKELHEGRVRQIDAEIEQVQKDMLTAIEEGESRKQVELQARLADLFASKKMADQALKTAKEAPAPRAEAGEEMQTVRPNTPAAEAWMKGKHWINNPAYREQNQRLLKVAEAVADDGYDGNSPEYYAEVERRMARRYPELFPAKGNGVTRRPGKQTVARVSRDDPPSARAGARNGKIVLTAEDLATMRRFGLDTKNRDHLREFARSKRESARNERGARA